MSNDGDSKLVLRAEAALAQAELREPDWDAFSARIESALGTASDIDDSLFLPPLPESTEDGREELAAPARAAHDSEIAPSAPAGGASLAELARATVARRSSKDAVDLAKASLAIASQGRALPETARRSEPRATAAVAAELTREREQSTMPPARREGSSLDTRGPWIGVAIATVGLAAGFGLYLSARTPETKVAATPPTSPAATLTTPSEPSAAARDVAKTTAPAEPHAGAAELLPVEKQAQADPMPSSAPAAEAAPVAVKPSAPAAPARPTATANTTRARPEKVVLDDDTTAATKGSAPKGTPSAMRPAELNPATGGITARPSTGAAQAAVGAVLGAARACIAGQPEASSATIVFGSSGEVTSVNVSGPADGTPAAACIKAALGKARVQPFAASSFSLGVTVRPL